MRDGDWYLGYGSYDDLPGASLYFGRQEHGIYCLTEPDIKFADPEAGDAALPGEDGVRFGRDYQRSTIVTFELGVDGVDGPVNRHHPPYPWALGRPIGGWTEAEAAQAYQHRTGGPEIWAADGVAMLRQAWRADAIRLKPSRIAQLDHMIGGRRRRLFGRPRKFEVAHSRLRRQGYVPVVAEFEAMDDRFYSSTDSQAEMWDFYTGGRPPRPGRPIINDGQTYFATSRKSVVLKVHGQLPTHPWIVIHGPCTNPKVSLANLWSVQLAMVIGTTERVVIDARPWFRTVTHVKASSSVPAATRLTRGSPRLGAMTLPPGNWTASLSYTRASSKIGDGPRAEIFWKDAYAGW